MTTSSIIMTKLVDWSTFTSGFNIPVEMQPTLYALMGRELAPTFHRIIHRKRPLFNRRKLQFAYAHLFPASAIGTSAIALGLTKTFEFPNGVVEPVRLNLHLK